MLHWLKSRYGDDNRWDAESDLKNLSMLGIDPAAFLGDQDTGLARVKASGGSIDPDVMFKTLLSEFHREFYQDYIRDQKKQPQGQITQEIYDSASKEMNVHYKAKSVTNTEEEKATAPKMRVVHTKSNTARFAKRKPHPLWEPMIPNIIEKESLGRSPTWQARQQTNIRLPQRIMIVVLISTS